MPNRAASSASSLIDQSGFVALAQLEQLSGLAQAARVIAGLVTVLQQGNAAIECRFNVGKKFPAQQLAVGNGIQAT